MKFRKGDVVTVEATIISGHILNDDRIQIRVEPYNDFFVDLTAIKVCRAKFEVGDRVFQTSKHSATVKAVDGENLWVESDVGGYLTWEAADTQRLDGFEDGA